MAELDIKNGQTWRLHAQYQDGKLRFGLHAAKQGDFGIHDDMWLTAEEWDRLAKWVAFQRADEKIQPHPFMIG